MKNVIKKIAGFAVSAILAAAMVSCTIDEENKSGKKIPDCVLVTGGTVTGASYTNNYEGVFLAGRKVTLSSFYMGKYEVTQAEYKYVMTGQKVTVDETEYTLEASPSYCTGSDSNFGIDYGKDHSNYPVEEVTWYDAVWYCNALSTKEGLKPCYTISVTTVEDNHITAATVTFDSSKNGYRLPTEAEWEYAARGGDQNDKEWNYVFSGADKASDSSYDDCLNSGLDSVGWYCFNNITGTTGDSNVTNTADGCETHEVGKKKENRLGLHDMSGNVFEWCWDWYGDISTDETVTDPAGASDSGYRVDRGGSWCGYADGASVSYRGLNTPGGRGYILGFRVVRNAN